MPLVFWGLAAFAGTVALGTLLGRTLPAVFLAVVVCVLVRGVWENSMNHFVLAPYAQLLPGQSDVEHATVWSESSSNDLVVHTQLYLDGKPWFGDQYVWQQERPTITDATGNYVSGPDPSQPWMSPYAVPFGFHGQMYWPVVAFESTVLFLGSLSCGAIGIFWVGRRRPY